MKRSFFHAIWGAVSALQIALAAGAAALSRLAYTRGGVNHHVAYRKRQYNALIFTPGKVLLMQIALVALAGLLAWLLIRAVRRRAAESAVLAGFCIALDAALIFELTAPAFRAVSIYPYAVLVTAVIFLLELILAALRRAVRD